MVNYHKIINNMVCIWLFLFTFRFLEKLDVLCYLLLPILLSYLTVIVFRKRYVLISFDFIFQMSLIVFFVIMYLDNWGNYHELILGEYFLYGINFAALFLAGYLIIINCKTIQLNYEMIIYACMMGSVCFVAGSFFLNFNLVNDRMVPNLWTGEYWHPTNFNSMGIYSVVGTYYLIFVQKRGIIKILGSIIAIVLSFISISTASRTNLVFLALMISIGICYDLLYVNRLRIFAFFKKRIGYIKVLILLIIVVIALFNIDYIINYFTTSALGERSKSYEGSFKLEDDPRWELANAVLESIWLYPQGNMPLFYAHNIVLDVARVAGIVPMLLMMVILMMAVLTIVSILRQNNCNREMSILIVLMTVGLLVSFMLEPVIEGRPTNFAIFCLIAGMNCAVKARTKKGDNHCARK